MSFFKNIQVALDTQLSTLSGGVVVAWENVDYTPTLGTPFIRPTMLIPSSRLATLSSTQYNQGIYRIDVFYPLQVGAGTLLTKLDAIYDHFRSQEKLTSSGTSVYIGAISRSSQATRDESWLTASIDINFRCYDN